MEVDNECIFCQQSDVGVYEMNANSVLIDGDLVEFDDLIYDLFYLRLRPDVLSHICEECKEQLIRFRDFKLAAYSQSHYLMQIPAFKSLSTFISNREPSDVPVITTHSNAFLVRYNAKSMQLKIPIPVKSEESVEIDEIVEIVPVEAPEEVVEEKYAFAEETFQDHQDEVSEFKLPVEFEHKKSSNMTCTICNIRFKDKKYFDIHQKAHENFNAIAHLLDAFPKCDECDRVFNNEVHLKTHKKNHKTGKVEIQQKIGAFEDSYIKLDTNELTTAVDSLDSSDLDICGHCGMKFSETAMKIHQLFFHTDNIICPIDGRHFTEVKQIRLFSDHIRLKHLELFSDEKEPLFDCKYCTATFPNHFKKLEHMKICDEKKYKCPDHCDKRFYAKHQLQSHLKSIEDDRFRCELCSKKCLSKSDLEIHMRMHTNERPYECSMCDKKFKTSANRSSHMDIHAGLKQHECDICNEKFQTRPILRKHKKSHDTNYQDQCLCKLCFRQYISRPHLLRHLKSFHNAPATTKLDDMEDFFIENMTSVKKSKNS